MKIWVCPTHGEIPERHTVTVSHPPYDPNDHYCNLGVSNGASCYEKCTPKETA